MADPFSLLDDVDYTDDPRLNALAEKPVSVLDPTVAFKDTAPVIPEEDPYLSDVMKAAANVQDDKTIRALEEAQHIDPEKYKRAMELSDLHKLPPGVIYRDLKPFDLRADLDKARTILSENPGLKEWFERGDNSKTITTGELEYTHGTAWMAESFSKSWELGWANNSLAEARMNEMFGVASPDEIAKADQISARVRADLGDESWLEQSWVALGEQIPYIGSIVGTGVKRSAQTGAVFAAGGAFFGPGGAAAAGLTGVGVGFTAGVGEGSFRLNAGLAFDEFRNFKDKDGNRADPMVARGAAIIAGSLMAGLDVVGMKLFMKAFPGFDQMIKGGARPAIRELLTNPTFQGVARRVAIATGAVVVGEPAIEVAQEAIQIMGGEITKAFSDGEFDPITPEMIGDRLLDAGEQALMVGMYFGTLAGSASLTYEVKKARQIEHDASVLSKLAARAKDDPLVKRDPAAAVSAMEAATKGLDKDTVYISPEKIQELLQDEEFQATFSKIPGINEAIQQSITTGGPIAIPLPEFYAHVAPTPFFEGMTQDIKIDPQGYTLNEGKDLLKAMEKLRAEGITGDPSNPSAKLVHDDVMAQSIAVGYKPAQAKHFATLYGAFFENMGNLTGQDPFEVYKSYNVRLSREELAGFAGPDSETLLQEAGKDDFNDPDLDDIEMASPGQFLGLAVRGKLKPELHSGFEPVKRKARKVREIKKRGGGRIGDKLKAQKDTIPEPTLLTAIDEASNAGYSLADIARTAVHVYGMANDIDYLSRFNAQDIDWLSDPEKLSLTAANTFAHLQTQRGMFGRPILLDEENAPPAFVPKGQRQESMWANNPDMVELAGEQSWGKMLPKGILDPHRWRAEFRRHLYPKRKVRGKPGQLVHVLDSAINRGLAPEDIVKAVVSAHFAKSRVYGQALAATLKAGKDPNSVPIPIRQTKKGSDRSAAGAAYAQLQEEIAEVGPAVESEQALLQGGEGRIVRGSITFAPDSTTIRLFKDANMSTLLHETGHLFLRVMSDLAHGQQFFGAETLMQDNNILKFPSKGTKALLTPERRREIWAGPELTALRDRIKNYAGALEQEQLLIAGLSDAEALGSPDFRARREMQLMQERANKIQADLEQARKDYTSKVEELLGATLFQADDNGPKAGDMVQWEVDGQMKFNAPVKVLEVITDPNRPDLGSAVKIEALGGISYIAVEDKVGRIVVIERAASKVEPPVAKPKTREQAEAGTLVRALNALAKFITKENAGKMLKRLGITSEQGKPLQGFEESWASVIQRANEQEAIAAKEEQAQDEEALINALEDDIAILKEITDKYLKAAAEVSPEVSEIAQQQVKKVTDLLELTEADVVEEAPAEVDPPEDDGVVPVVGPNAPDIEPVAGPQAFGVEDIAAALKAIDSDRKAQAKSTRATPKEQRPVSLTVAMKEELAQFQAGLEQEFGKKTRKQVEQNNPDDLVRFDHINGLIKEKRAQIKKARVMEAQQKEIDEQVKKMAGAEYLNPQPSVEAQPDLKAVIEAYVSKFHSPEQAVSPEEIEAAIAAAKESFVPKPDTKRRDKSSKQLVADLAIVNEWLGETGPNYSVAAQEKFAKGFEVYLFEGVAPSRALEGAFARFKQWLTLVYRKITNLGVVPTPEVREVFDRLLSSDDAIQDEFDQPTYNPAIVSAEQAGITDQQFEDYMASAGEIKAEARRILDKRMMEEVDRVNSDILKNEKTKIRKEVTDEFEQKRVFRLMSFLLKGDPTGTMENVKLNRAEVLAIVGKGNLKHVPRKMYEEGGQGHPDLVAALFGYQDGVEMINDIVATGSPKAAIEAETVRRFEAANPPKLKTAEDVKAEARVSVNNVAREKFLQHELKILHDILGWPTDTVSYQAMRRLAVDIVSEKSVKEISKRGFVNRFMGADRSLGQLIDKAAREKDWQKVIQLRRKQLMNHYLIREASRLKDEVARAKVYLTKFNKKQARAIDQVYLSQIRNLLIGYELIKGQLDPSVKPFSQFLDAELAARELLVVDPAVAKKAGKPYEQLTSGEFVALKDAVSNLEFVGRNKRDLIKDGRKKSAKSAVERIAESMDKYMRPRKASKNLNPGWLEKGVLRLKGLQHSHLKIEQIVDWMDGGAAVGPAHEAIFQPMADAQKAERKLIGEFSDKLLGIIETKPTSYYNRKFSVPGIGLGMRMSEAISVALNVGNEQNRFKLTKGMGWTEEQVDGILDQLDEQDWQNVQKIWDTLDELWPMLSDTYRVMGRPKPDKVQPSYVKNKFGGVKGGYYPIIYDPKKSGDIARRGAMTKTEEIFGFELNSVFPTAGFMQDRSSQFARPLMLDLSVLPVHVGRAIHLITHAEPLRNVNVIMNDPEISNRMIKYFGPRMNDVFAGWLSNITKGELAVRGLQDWEAFLGRFRQNITTMALGLKAMAGVAQFGGLISSSEMIGGKSVAYGIWDTFGTLSFSQAMENLEWIKEKSGEMAHRTSFLERDLADIAMVISTPQKIKKRMRTIAMAPILVSDSIVAASVWKGAYLKQLKVDPHDDAKAVAYADKVVRLTQGSGAAKDLAAVQRGGEFLRFLTMFYTYFNAMHNRLSDVVRQGAYATSDIKYEGADRANMFVRYFYLIVLPTLLFDFGLRGALTGAHKDKEPEELVTSAMLKVMSYSFTGAVGVRDVAQFLLQTEDGYKYQFAPMARALERLTSEWQRTIRASADEKKDVKAEDLVRMISDSAGYSTGLPTDAFAIPIENMIKASKQGDGFGLSDLLVRRYQEKK